MELQKIETLLLQEMEEVKGGINDGTCVCKQGAHQSSQPGGTCVCSSGGGAAQIGEGTGVEPPMCQCQSGAVA
jgi:hypothetical protein